MTQPSDAPRTALPDDDRQMLEAVAHIAQMTYAQQGHLAPFGAIQVDRMVMIVPAGSMTTDEDKVRFIGLMRYLSIEKEGLRSAIAMESWVVRSRDPADLTLMNEIMARGGSLQEHPRVEEALCVIVESDAGCSQQMNIIVRDGDTVTLEAGDVDFEERGASQDRGLFSNFHVPTSIRSLPPVMAFADAMRQMVETVDDDGDMPRDLTPVTMN